MKATFVALWLAAVSALWLAAVSGYVTHLWWTLSALVAGTVDTVNMAVIAILGTVFPPLGVLHGFYLWFH